MSQTDVREDYFCLLTNAGSALEAAAHEAGVPVKLKWIAVGDGAGEVPLPTQNRTALVNEVYRREIDGRRVDEDDPNICWLHAVIPALTGGFWIREFGIYAEPLTEGGEPVLYAYGNHAPYYKTENAAGQATTHQLEIPIIMSGQTALEIQVKDLGYASQSALNAVAAVADKASQDIAWLKELALRNLAPNDEIVITESGDWEVPESGLYHVTIIGGGNGGLGTLKDLTNRYQELTAEGGDSGGREEVFRYYEKGQIIPVTIGAGGIGQILVNSTDISPTKAGGKTSFDDITTKTSWETGHHCMLGEVNFAYGAWHVSAVGGGIGAGQASNAQAYANGQQPGAGGGVYLTTPPSTYRVAGNGHDGAVILRRFNLAKANPEQEEEQEGE